VCVAHPCHPHHHLTHTPYKHSTSHTHPHPDHQAPIDWEWGLIAGCCVVFVLASEAYKAWIRPTIARSEKAALKRIKQARQGSVISDGLEFVVVATGAKKEEDLDDDAVDSASEGEETKVEQGAVAQQQRVGKALVGGGAARAPMSAQ
jgi:hypothetical protein